MSHADFVHLRVHSAYSLLEGAIKIGDLIELCREHNMPAVAITDKNNLFGALEFSIACQKSGVQPIVGCEMTLDVNPNFSASAENAENNAETIILLVQNNLGWKNLIALSSYSHLKSPAGQHPRIYMKDLKQHSEGLIILSGGPGGPIGSLLLDGKLECAEDLVKDLSNIFPNRFYIELMRHGIDSETQTEEDFINLAYKFDIPLVATNDVYFASREKYESQDALMCIAEGRHVDEDRPSRLTPDYYFKPSADMMGIFSDIPEAINNTLIIAQRCAFMAPVHDPILPPFPLSEGASESFALKNEAEKGLDKRLKDHVFSSTMTDMEMQVVAKPYWERLNFELSVISDMNFPGYFLIVAEFISWAKAENIPVGPGRGSGAGSLVAWALTITDLDPLRFGLLFERFLNPERVSMPDFDIDFCQEQRDRVIEHVCDKYGRDRVAQIITFGKLQARAVIRDVGRVLGMPYGQVDRLSKLIPFNPANPLTLQQAIDGEPQFQMLIEEDQAVAHLIRIALELEGLYRHASTHAAGVVISDRPLQELVPLYRDPRSEMPVTQYSMKYVESAGLVKFDFLGLKTLSVLEMACSLVKAGGLDIDLTALPLDDPVTFKMLGKGTTMGVFQLESSGMRDVLRSMKPDSFEDIIALVALYRPGPMGNIPKFVACKHGEEEPDYLHDSLKEILRETYGVIVYQEQVMQIAQVLAGYSLGSADLLRRAMGKKIKSEMDSHREIFVSGAVERGVDVSQATQIFDLVSKFADYGFNKSHAAAYALVAYQTAYFKANYTLEFMAASMSFELRDTDKIAVFRQELERMNICMLPPDINKSDISFVVEETDNKGTRAIRYALAAIKNVGDVAMKALVAERNANGQFNSIFDLAARVGSGVLNKRQLENLVRAGCFDKLDSNRKKLFNSVELFLRFGDSVTRNLGQESLFGSGPDMGMPEPTIPDTVDWPPLERLNFEQQAIGFYLSSHPLRSYNSVLDDLRVATCENFAELCLQGVTSVNVVGVVLNVQERDSSGRRFAFVQLSDPTGSFEVAFFQDSYNKCRNLLEVGQFLLIRANIRAEAGTYKLIAQGAEDLEVKAVKKMKGLAISFADSTPLASLRQLFDDAEEGAGKVTFLVSLPEGGHCLEISLKKYYALSPAIKAQINEIPGVLSVVDC